MILKISGISVTITSFISMIFDTLGFLHSFPTVVASHTKFCRHKKRNHFNEKFQFVKWEQALWVDKGFPICNLHLKVFKSHVVKVK